MSNHTSKLAYDLNEAEMKALAECSVESFYYRCFPLMTLFGIGTYIGIKKGKLKHHYKYGAIPKVFLACCIGYFLGKISYTNVCTDKVIAVPGSKLGDFLLRRKLGLPFSPEEMRVLQECNRESFYQRCLPLGTLFGIGTYMGVKSGYFQPSAKFGPTPKVIGAVVIGYFLGKISYQAKCAEKLMAVPDSKIGAMLRSRKFGGGQSDTLILEDHELEKAVSGMPESEKFSDISSKDQSQKNQLDMDFERPMISGIDDYRPNFDDVRVGDDAFLPPSGSRSTSYEELRRRNREDFEQRRTKAYRGVVTPEDVPSGLREEDQAPRDSNPPPLNTYGDYMWGK